ncbi:MAG TPA: hypothetical protein VNH11_21695 [Pirellulales bacterium]|nr:hypothetical protein [Pirellulales bacterium]
MSSRQNPYVGRSGQMAVLAVLLERGYNVAVPEVDRGDDLYVVHDRSGLLYRVQVKSATGKGKKRVSGAFNISLDQLRTPRQPDLNYVLVLMHPDGRREFLVISRSELEYLWEFQGVGHLTDHGRRIVLHISFSQHGVECNGISLDKYRDNWSLWPKVVH